MDCDIYTNDQEALMVHRNAPLIPTGRERLARCVVEDGWSLHAAADRFQAAPTTAKRWAGRYRALGWEGMADASSRPARSPRRTPTRRERRVVKLRCTRRWGTARIGGHLGMHAWTVHRILTRYKCPRLAHTDRAVRRYEHARPGQLVHVDIKKLGNIPDGGGHKVLGRPQGRKNRSRAGYAYLHNAVDDHSRLAYTEILAEEKKETATAFWGRARAYFASAGTTVERVLTDNGMCYRSHLWRDLLADQQIKHKRPRPYRSETERRQALEGWLHHYNHHRFHTAISSPRATRVPNLSDQYT